MQSPEGLEDTPFKKYLENWINVQHPYLPPYNTQITTYLLHLVIWSLEGLQHPLHKNLPANKKILGIHSFWQLTLYICIHSWLDIILGTSTTLRTGDSVPFSTVRPQHCVQMDFMWTFATTTKCNNINHVWSHFYKLMVVLKYHRPGI